MILDNAVDGITWVEVYWWRQCYTSRVLQATFPLTFFEPVRQLYSSFDDNISESAGLSFQLVFI